MAHPLLKQPSEIPGGKMLLLGNEAIVRGALEGGIGFVSCYPGTPSSEVPDTFYRLSKEGKYYFEYSPNEKVALEVGGGAAIGGASTLVTMKHVGVNVAADPLMTLTYVGAPGGLVLLSADDPGCHSSQNEQDNRYYARLANMPCFEPSTAQEAKDMTRDALALARKSEQPVLLRTTTRVNHLRGAVDFGTVPDPQPLVEYSKNPGRFVPVPANARVRRLELLANMDALRGEAENSPWNTVSGEGSLGIIASGISRAYVRDCLTELDAWKAVQLLDLGFTYPLPENMLAKFLKSVDKVLIVEELEPILENDIRALVQKLGIDVEIMGKGENMPRNGEYSTTNVGQAILSLLEETPENGEAPCAPPQGLPMRPPNLCAGCSHRALYYSVRQVFGNDAHYSSDIGCYTLGILPPLSMADFLLCMGSSVSAGCGLAKATGKPVVAFIGDSTFFHSGITGLVNAVFNQHDLLLVVLDNRTTAMTGHQPNPGVDQSSIGPNEAKVDVEAIARGCGVEHVRKVNPNKLKPTMEALEDYKALGGVRVIIAEEPCVLFARRALGKKPGLTAYVAEQNEGVMACVEQLACPAFYKEGDDVRVDESQCSGCTVCMQIAPGFKAKKR